jgi:hypothetical protein
MTENDGYLSRSLPPDHPNRIALLRQLEIAAAVAGELESLLGLGGKHG